MPRCNCSPWCVVCGALGKTTELRITWRANGSQITPREKKYDLCQRADCAAAALRREAERYEAPEVEASSMEVRSG